ncbi:MAG: response regulator [Planctomycetes bacterium]|nr:response regulator [Planctomycetota bacterium]
MEPSDHPVRHVLVVDDNVGDFVLLREAFRSMASEVVLHHVPDAPSALAFLEHPGPDAPLPNLVLIDLGLPPPGGKAILQHLHRSHIRIPAVVLTGSTRRVDRDDCLHLGAVHYAVKPSYFGDYLALVEFMSRYLRHREANHPHDTPTPTGTAILGV